MRFMESEQEQDDLLKEEFSNWAKVVLSLQKARDGSINYIKREMEPFVDELLRMHGADEKDHFQDILTKVAVNGKVNEIKKPLPPKDRFVLADNKCTTCDKVFGKQLETFEESRWHGKKWVCNSTEEQIDPSSYWWVLAKLYMLKSNVTDAKKPEEVEPSAIFKLFSNCNLFEKLQKYGKKLIELRNKLVHSADNRLTEEEMKESFKLIKEFLMQVADNKTEVINEVEKLEQTTVVLFKKDGEFSELAKEAFELQKISLNADFQTSAGIRRSGITALGASNIAIKQYRMQLQELRTELELQKSKLELTQLTHTLEITLLQREKEEIQLKYDALNMKVEEYKVSHCTIS